jgi:periplasmic divalent cation tolerance protein
MTLDADCVLVLCTAPTVDVATELARGLVAEKLAACVNFFAQVSSVYCWKGALEQQQEVQLLIKTRRERYADVERWLVEHHPYEVPEVLAIPIEAGSAQYLAWLREQTG